MNDLDLLHRQNELLTRIVEQIIVHESEIMREVTDLKGRVMLLEERTAEIKSCGGGELWD
jgi:hypothetical protein